MTTTKNILDLKLPSLKSYKNIPYEQISEIMNTDFSTNNFFVKSSDCKVDEQMDLHFNSKKIPMSFQSLEKISNLLKIPFRFSKQIPVDLLVDNINRLFMEKNVDINFFVSKKYEYLVDASFAFEKKVNFSDIKELLPKYDFTAFSNIYLSENKLNFQSFSEKITSTPRVGDLTRFGVDFDQNWLFNSIPKSRIASYTLACSNGAIYPSKEGKISSNKDLFKFDFESFLKSSQNTIKKFQISNEKFLNINDLRWVYSTVKKVSKEVANQSLNTNELVMKSVSKRVNILKKIHKNRSNDEILYPLSEKTVYDAFWGITHVAHTSNLNKDDQIYLEKYAGKLIEDINLN